MMQDRHEEGSVGDTAVDGLLAGFVAGVAMAFYLLAVGLLSAGGPTTLLGYVDSVGVGDWLKGLLAHLAVSGLYGALFALLADGLRRILSFTDRRLWLLGLVYGLFLWVLARGVMATAVAVPWQQIAPQHFVLGHLIYGAVVGYWLGKE